MTRDEFEYWYAKVRAQTVAAMGRRGWVSAPDPDDGDQGMGCGWQAICVPPDATKEERARILSGLTGVQTFGQDLAAQEPPPPPGKEPPRVGG